jgi:transcription elongation factor Elf1
MLILFGLKTTSRTLLSRPGTCLHCRQYAQQDVVERATKFTIFFIPVLTTSRRFQLHCGNCGHQTALTRQQKNALTA